MLLLGRKEAPSWGDCVRHEDRRNPSGFPQIELQIAAPQELRTPMGTAAKELPRECGWKHGDQAWNPATQWKKPLRETEGMTVGRESGGPLGRAARLRARMRRCLILRQGTSPLRPPAPFPSDSRFQIGRHLSRVRKPRKSSAPLTNPSRSEKPTGMRERGPLYMAPSCASRWSARNVSWSSKE